MRELPDLNTERLEFTQQQVDKVFHFETPDVFPIFFGIADHHVDAEQNKFADQHMVQRQLTSWRDVERTLDESLNGIRWWNEQTLSPLQVPPSLGFSCQQEAILTPFGVAYRIFDDGSIKVDYGTPIIRDMDDDLKRLEDSKDGWLGRGLIPELMEKFQYCLDETGHQIPVAIPDWQSPLGLAAKLIGSTPIVYAMMEQPDKLRRVLDFCAAIMVEFAREVERICGRKELFGGGLLPSGSRGFIFDDYISITPPSVFIELAVAPNDRVLGHFNGGEIHTCGPVSGGIVESFAAHKNIKSFDFFFVTPDKTRTTAQLRELKKECRRRVVMNVAGMVFDEKNFTVDFVREMKDGGGVFFTGVVGSLRQVARWCEIAQGA